MACTQQHKMNDTETKNQGEEGGQSTSRRQMVTDSEASEYYADEAPISGLNHLGDYLAHMQ